MRVTVGGVALASPIVAASGTFGHGAEVLRLVGPGATRGGDSEVARRVRVGGQPRAASRGDRRRDVELGRTPGTGRRGVDRRRAPCAARRVRSRWSCRCGVARSTTSRAAPLLAPAADACAAIELNVSCPNVEDASRMFAHSPEATHAVVAAVARGRRGPAAVREAVAQHVRGRRGRPRRGRGRRRRADPRQHAARARDRRRAPRARCSAASPAGTPVRRSSRWRCGWCTR